MTSKVTLTACLLHPAVFRDLWILPLSSASVTWEALDGGTAVCVQRGSPGLGAGCQPALALLFWGWSLEEGRCRRSGWKKVCTLGGWGAWGHGQGEDVPCHPQTLMSDALFIITYNSIFGRRPALQSAWMRVQIQPTSFAQQRGLHLRACFLG